MKFRPVFLRSVGRLPAAHLWYMAKQLRYENPHTVNGKTHVNSFFPPYPSKAFDRFLEAAFNRWRVPYSVYFAVTDKCPYRCPHCSYGRHVSGSLDTEQAIKIIEQIKSIGTITIGFTGGEPLLRDDIVQLVNAAGNDTATVLFTTGFNLTASLAKDLQRAGLGCMTIGIESADRALHNSVRGSAESFNIAIRAIRVSLEAGLYTAISTVATRQKLNDGTVEQLAKMATGLSVQEFRILEPVPTGSFCKDTEQILTAEESRRLAQFHKDWNKSGKGPAIACFAHLESYEMFGCGAGFHHMFMDAVGNVCPCDLTPLSMGNCLDEPLYEIWSRMSQWFALPRCGCLMKELCSKAAFDSVNEFPIDKATSEQLCAQVHHSELPAVFSKLFKNRKPANPPLHRQPL